MAEGEKIKTLIEQVDRFCEGVAEFRLSLEASGYNLNAILPSQGIDRQECSTKRFSESAIEIQMTKIDFQDLKVRSERQERNIDRLVGIVETLIQSPDRRTNPCSNSDAG